MNKFDELRKDAASRRAFLQRMTAAGLGAAAIALFSPGFQASLFAKSPSGSSGGVTPARAKSPFGTIPGRTVNEQALNFALTLEILEADLYRQALNAASGLPLTTPLNANAGSYSLAISNGGLPADRTTDAFDYHVQFSYVEAAHRDFLATAIQAGGGTPVTANPNGYGFPGGPAADLHTLLVSNILPLEETGVRAYLGALPYITDLSLAQVAATIFSTEARHSAVIKYINFVDPNPNRMAGDQLVISKYPHPNTLEYFLTPTTVLTKASAYFK